MNLMFSVVSSRDFYWRLLMVLCAASMLIAVSESAFAANGSAANNDVIGGTLCTLVANINGGIARSIATMAIFAVGISLFMGKLNWGTAAMTGAGVAIVFGSAKLVGWLSGDANNSNCPTAGAGTSS
jgi:type IV secretory pathway VirB2 component (pilin)